MSFKASGAKTRPERVKPPTAPPAASSSPPEPTSAFPQPVRHRAASAASSTSSQGDAVFHDARFPPDEEQSMIQTSNEIKKDANRQFANLDYGSAISTYDKALAELPSYLEYELAVLQSNIAACHVKLEQWKEAMEACEKGLDGLERELPTKEGQRRKMKTNKRKTKNEGNGRKGLESDSEDEDVKQKEEEEKKGEQNGQVVELPSDAEDEVLEQKLNELNLSDERKRDITRIRTKLLLRRARAKASVQPPSWANLGGALEDYQLLSSKEYFASLPASDQKTVRQALVSLPPRVNEAKDKEMGEMMGKLKELGNGILKPFGLSTDMFKMTQGADGGWSMSIDQNGGGAKS